MAARPRHILIISQSDLTRETDKVSGILNLFVPQEGVPGDVDEAHGVQLVFLVIVGVNDVVAS